MNEIERVSVTAEIETVKRVIHSLLLVYGMSRIAGTGDEPTFNSDRAANQIGVRIEKQEFLTLLDKRITREQQKLKNLTEKLRE